MPKSFSELFSKIRRIEIETTHLAKNLLAGLYRSAFKGRGMEFDEVREYQNGDEIRQIDWNVTARTGRPYVKSFREERELTIILAVDISFSTQFGSVSLSKRERMAEIAALFAFSAIQSQDRIGLLLFSKKVEKYIPPGKGSQHVLRLLRDLLTIDPTESGTDPASALSFLMKVQTRSGVVILLSDLLYEDPVKEMSLAARHYDFISIAVLDPLERAYPDVGLVRLKNMETNEVLTVDSSLRAERDGIAKKSTDRIKQHEAQLKKLGASFLLLQSDLPFLPPLKRFFAQRARRRA